VELVKVEGNLESMSVGAMV
jgi:hypothetical protein